jgi:hypothetical protein
LTRHQRRFTQFTRPVFPSPVTSRMEREPSGFPLSFEPRRPEPDNARQGGDRPTEHGPETTLYDISRTSNPARLLVVCDLASHGVKQQRAPGSRLPLGAGRTRASATSCLCTAAVLHPAGRALLAAISASRTGRPDTCFHGTGVNPVCTATRTTGAAAALVLSPTGERRRAAARTLHPSTVTSVRARDRAFDPSLQ